MRIYITDSFRRPVKVNNNLVNLIALDTGSTGFAADNEISLVGDACSLIMKLISISMAHLHQVP